MNGDTKMILQAITELRTEFKKDIAGLRTEFKSDLTESIEGLKAEFKSDIADLRAEMKAEFQQVHKKIDYLNDRIDSQLYRIGKLEEEQLILKKKAW